MTKTLFILSFIFLATTVTFAQTPTPTPKVTGNVIRRAIDLAKPIYPTFAKGEKVGGKVEVQVTIDEKGNVILAKAISGSAKFQEAAVKAALASKFALTILQGKPVKITGTIIYNFHPKETNEEKLKYTLLGVFFPIARTAPMNEWGAPLTEKQIANEPILKEILLPITQINSQTGMENRLKILNQVQESLEKILTGDNAWQFNFGKELGGLMTEIAKINNDHTANLDEIIVKKHLSKMSDSLVTAPPEYPLDILGKFKEIITLRDTEKLNSDENKAKIVQLIMEVGSLIYSDSDN